MLLLQPQSVSQSVVAEVVVEFGLGGTEAGKIATGGTGLAALDMILADLENGKTDLAIGRMQVLRQSFADRIPRKAEAEKEGVSPGPAP